MTFKDRLAALGFATYDDYLQSPHWTEFKQRWTAKNKIASCAACGQVKAIQFHHQNYDNLGHEEFEDVVPLCDRHHEDVHLFLKIHGKSVKHTKDAIALMIRQEQPSRKKQKRAGMAWEIGQQCLKYVSAAKTIHKVNRMVNNGEVDALASYLKKLKPAKAKHKKKKHRHKKPAKAPIVIQLPARPAKKEQRFEPLQKFIRLPKPAPAKCVVKGVGNFREFLRARKAATLERQDWSETGAVSYTTDERTSLLPRSQKGRNKSLAIQRHARPTSDRQTGQTV